MQSYFDYSSEVLTALNENKPVIALESTIITHGMPYPENIETAKSVEAIAREEGVTPATIAILNGRIKIGLSHEDLENLVMDNNVTKASRFDIPFILAKKMSAGTTVASTLFCAHRAGIKIFATGGIGGVHRGDAMDVSSDITELARTPIAVVCAGAKAILDLSRTLEYLETMSIPVIGYKTNSLPAFYSASSPHRLSHQVNNVDELAQIMRIHWDLQLSSGALVVNPIPKEHEIPAEVIHPVIEKALETAVAKGITGKAITPFLLAEVAHATQGKSLIANIHLIKNNVKLAAILARSI